MNITRIFDILEISKQKFPNFIAFGTKRDGQWKNYSIEEYIEIVNFLSYGFLALGVKRGDKIASIFSNNRPEWNFIDMATAQIGAIHVPLYPTMSVDDLNFILIHSDSQWLFVSDKLLYQKIYPIASKIEAITHIYSTQPFDNIPDLSEIIELGKTKANFFSEKVLEIKKTITSDDLLTIIYTSGTTGISKGVMLSHKNVLTNLFGSYKAIPLTFPEKVLSFLPLCHIYERIFNYAYQILGVSIFYAEHTGTIMNNLKELKVQGINMVPRVLEKVYDAILQKAKNFSSIKKFLFHWSLKVAEKYELNNKNGILYAVKLFIARSLVLGKLKDILGREIRFVGCGGAALQSRLVRIFWASQIPVAEGYGLTETSPVIALNYGSCPNRKIGMFARLTDNVEVKIAEDGEILCRGDIVMKGYYKNPELTREVIDAEGWFHTGDIGHLVDGKYLKITDRKKEIFKISSGKYISPQTIENKFKESTLIEQLIVVGENQKFASAIISPNFNALNDWCVKNNLRIDDRNELIKHPKIVELFQREIKKLNKFLGQIEEVKGFKLVPDEWTPTTGELSPTLKLKRKVIYNKYLHLLAEIYRGY